MIKLKDLLSEVFEPMMLEQTPKYKFYLDLDGVVVDLVKAVKQLTGGLDFQEYEAVHGLHSIWKVLGAQDSMWWATLPWTGDGRELWNFLKDKEVVILTSGSTKHNGQTPKKGKHEWCFKNLGSNVKVIVVDSSHDKQRYAEPNAILIDDLNSNIDEWKSKGGIGILHKNTADTINQIKQLTA